MKRLLALLLAVARRGPAFGQIGRADRQCARRAFGRRRGGEAGRAVLGRPAPDHPAEVAHLLEEPGRSGLPTEIKWTLPAGVTADPIVWPTPHRYRYRRRHQLRLPGRSRAAGAHHAAGRSRRAARSKLAAEANWLVCEDVCIPEDGKFELSLPIAAAGDAGAASHARDLRQGAPERADGKPVAGALWRRQVGRSDPDRRGQRPEARHDPRRLFLPGRMGPDRQHGQAKRQRQRRRHPHPAEEGRRQGGLPAASSPARWC